ncbi:substrate-binding domain-containing protein [Roseibium marinum]|uniref:Phosphate transport system substrate-binding protein n=1 Tax=Roseibium marinum TaxID=281252 RepID=A0A2S3V4M9_9HYPH|nr:substrate-binding domain-containing protein [Roseibium marinum]POF34875.1 phosphate transport system substrate-binding protein [Roseibium marinum]
MARNFTAGAVVCCAFYFFSFSAEARDRLLIVGSSTVYPFATAVAEKVGHEGMKYPIVESTGSGAGFGIFCQGVGEDTPDITNASRRMKPSELETCNANGVTPVEVRIGYDGIVLANSIRGPKFSLTIDQIFQALAEKLPGDGTVRDNPNASWSDIDPSLPAEKIEVLGPPPTSGTRDAFVELVMERGCKSAAGLDGSACTRMRRDGSFVEAGENDDLIVAELEANPVNVGIFGYSFLMGNLDKIQSVGVNGVEPDFDRIASGEYPVSRPLFFYIKKEHVGVVPGLEEYVAAFTSEDAWGDDGYLAGKGLIPLTADARRRQAQEASVLKALKF